MKPCALAILVLSIGIAASGLAANAGDETELLRVRELVWRAYFAGDTKTLKELLPTDTIAISSGSDHWDSQPEILEDAAKFHADGGKLIRLEFKDTKIQRYGDAAMLYTRYLYEIKVKNKRSIASGRVTEFFVRRAGKWLNPGWHTDSKR